LGVDRSDRLDRRRAGALDRDIAAEQRARLTN
jgi:hypothetical protein